MTTVLLYTPVSVAYPRYPSNAQHSEETKTRNFIEQIKAFILWEKFLTIVAI